MKEDSSNFEVKAFIEEIEKRPQIYNYNLRQYGNRSIVDGLWREVASIFDESVDGLKLKWKKIRTCYSRSLNKREKLYLAQDPALYLVKPYYLSENLEFLKEFTRKAAIPHVFADFDDGDNDNSEFVDTSNMVTSPISSDKNVTQIDNSALTLNTGDEEKNVDTQNTVPAPVMIPATSVPRKKAKKRRPLMLESSSEDEDSPDHSQPKRTALRCDTNTEQEFNVYCDPKRKHPMEYFISSLLPRVTNMTEQQQSEFQMGVMSLVHSLKYNQN